LSVIIFHEEAYDIFRQNDEPILDTIVQ
jgi:hypothetical protein